MKAFLVHIILFCCFGSITFGQNTTGKSLEEWDSIAFAAFEQNDNDAMTIALKFKEASLKEPASMYRVNAFTILGILNKDKGYYISSINNYLKALNAAKAIKDDGRVSACYNNIGRIYYLKQNYPRSKEYYFKSLEIEEKLNNDLQKSIRYYNLGEAFLAQDSFDIALSYFNNSLRIEQKKKSDEGIMYALNGISEVYIEIGRLTDAMISLESLEKYNLSAFPKIEVPYFKNRARLSLKKAKYLEALAHLNKASELSEKYELRIYSEDIYKYQIEVYRGLKQWENVADTYAKYIALLEALNNRKVKNQLEDLTYQNEINQRDLELKLISEQRDLAQQQTIKERQIASYENKIVWFLILSLFVLVLLILVGIRKITKQA